jgi:hypothetical protein
MMRKLLLFPLLLSLLSARLEAFPEMIRHGYGSCTACHIAPNGGGVLSKYGRTLSHEALSHWTFEGDEAFGYGLVKLPEWLDLQGEFRSLEMVRTQAVTNKSRFILMQADLEASAKYKDFGAVATFGYSDDFVPQKFVDGLLSRRHWLSYSPVEGLSFRAGRFYPAFGVNFPDHVVATRRGLGFDERMESYNVEASWQSDPWEAFATAVLGRPDKPDYDREKGVALQGAYYFAERFKIGLSYYYGSNSVGHRHLAGPYALLGFTKQLYLVTEADYTNTASAFGGPAANGLAEYARLGYEFLQGFHVFVTQELLQADLSAAVTRSTVYGAGLQLFPFTHTELQAVYQKRGSYGAADDDWLFFLFHFYL